MAFPGRTDLTEAVARYYFKLMASKDEYEVARLHVDSGFLAAIDGQFEGDYRVVFNLSPPLLSKRDPVTAELKKREFGPWIIPVFRVLAKLRFLRGTMFDPFGHTDERRQDRALITRYEGTITTALSALDVVDTALKQAHYDTVIALAALPEHMRGYGHVRARSLEQVHKREQALLNGTSEELLNAPPRRVIPIEQAA